MDTRGIEKCCRKKAFLLALGLVAASPAVAQDPGGPPGRVLSEGEVSVSVRYRFEQVEQDNRLEDAQASTARTRLTGRSGRLNGFGALLEIDNVSTLGADKFDSFVLDDYRGTHSLIADPVGSEVNQAFIDYDGGTDRFVLGRQRIQHDGQRFVGGVAWRQNEQTYDALSWIHRSDSLDIDYSYIWNVNRIFGSSRSSVQPANLRSRAHVLLLSSKQSWGTLSGHVYALQFSEFPALSNLTYGLSWAGGVGPLSLIASVSAQTEYGEQAPSYDAIHQSLETTLPLGPMRLLAGYELLGSDNGVASFNTPLATLHKFQGWADLFLNTPADGLEDLYAGVTTTMAGFTLSAFYHDFSAHESGAEFGGEWDLSAAYRFNNRVQAELKYASYGAEAFAVDTKKFWFTLNLAL